MTAKKNPNLTRREALILAWKDRKDYKGYDKSKGSLFNSWRAKIYTKKGRAAGFPDKWRTFEGFSEDVGEGWAKDKILVRFDVKKPYSKENCTWANKGEETMYSLITLEHNGETKTLVEWARELKLNYNGIRCRYFSKKKSYTSEEILYGLKARPRRKIIDIEELEMAEQRKKVSKMISQYRRRDEKKGLGFNLTIDNSIHLFKKKCVYCGDEKKIGLDRIDNSKGHTLDNVVPCCYVCNVTRLDNFTHEEMIILGKTVKQIKNARRIKNN